MNDNTTACANPDQIRVDGKCVTVPPELLAKLRLPCKGADMERNPRTGDCRRKRAEPAAARTKKRRRRSPAGADAAVAAPTARRGRGTTTTTTLAAVAADVAELKARVDELTEYVAPDGFVRSTDTATPYASDHPFFRNGGGGGGGAKVGGGKRRRSSISIRRGKNRSIMSPREYAQL